MEDRKYYAHTKTSPDGTLAPQGEWQLLEAHLKNVAEMSSGFASNLGLARTGELLGYLHDFGKYSEEFQKYITGCSEANVGDIDHSTAGAQYVFRKLLNSTADSLFPAQIIALCLASHHSGLINCIDVDGVDVFSKRIGKDVSETHVEKVKSAIPEELHEKVVRLLNLSKNELLTVLKTVTSRGDSPEVAYFKVSLFIRMLFSCLIDADRIDAAGRTEKKGIPAWAGLSVSLEKYLSLLEKGAKTKVGKIRGEISESLKNSAQNARGVYSLTVPTGGGKTLSSLRFALHHAQAHSLERIIYVLPYTSIIDQNAECVRKALGLNKDTDVLLEHHSNLAPEEYSERQKLLSENWDAPIIFTTNVQFLETVFGSGTKTARRMHRLAKSLIIFDEVQTIPINCVHIFNNVVNLLVNSFGATVIISTATQPLLDKVNPKFGSLVVKNGNHLVQNPLKLFESLKRVEVFDKRKNGGWSDDDIVGLISEEAKYGGSVLVVVNTKTAAYEIYRRCKKAILGRIYHLSANMAPAHRLKLINQIKSYLSNRDELLKSPVICVSTQLIEAGVDIDFGSVVRYLAGLDSVAQAAGRCNRNGTLPVLGRVYIVNPSNENTGMLPDIEIGREKAQRVLDEFKDNPRNFDGDILGPKAMARYFEYFFFQRAVKMVYPVHSSMGIGRDDNLISLLSRNSLSVAEYTRREQKAPSIPLRQSFMTAAKVFQAISSPVRGIVVPCDESAKALINDLCSAFKITGGLLHKAQRYSVNVYPNVFKKLQDAHALYEAQEGSGVLVLRTEYYHPEFGLTLSPLLNNDVLIA